MGVCEGLVWWCEVFDYYCFRDLGDGWFASVCAPLVRVRDECGVRLYVWGLVTELCYHARIESSRVEQTKERGKH